MIAAKSKSMLQGEYKESTQQKLHFIFSNLNLSVT